MNKLKEQIERVVGLLQTAEKRLEVAGNRWEANHDKAHQNHKAAKEAEREASKYRKAGQVQRAEAEDAKAARCHHRAWKAKQRADHFVGKAKEFAQEVHDLKESLEVKEGKLDALGPRVSPDNPNKVVGGDAKDRLEFAMHYSEIHGSQYYSQSGPTTVRQGLQGPTPGHRHDCSSWFTSMYWSCGLPDPNGGPEYVPGETTFTGSIGEGGKPISESELDTGDAILYGTAPFHHIEMKDGPMSEGPWTVGHGSSRIDRGVVALLPGPRAYRRFPKD